VYTWQDDAYVKIMPNQFRLTKRNGLTMTFSNWVQRNPFVVF